MTQSASPEHEHERSYEVVVFGATGFTGGMTAEYLARHAPDDLRWAIAGRSQSRLDAVKARLLAIDPACARVGTLVASIDDSASLARMVASTRVLLTTVGPFIDYGEPVVAACVKQGTDYVDSTGEPHFVDLLLARYDAPARAAGARIVPSCGFDSIPADLGALYTVSQLPAGQPIALDGYLSLKAAFSGGTERSAIKSLVPPPAPYDVPPHEPPAGRRVRARPAKVARRPELGGWVAPLQTVDAKIVLRSAASLDRYGPDFSYAHHTLFRSLPALLAAGVVFGALAVLVRVRPVRACLLALVKKPGRGPSEAQMRTAWFKLRFCARAGGQRLETEVSGGDPGYQETSKMLAESALCLARDRAALPPRAGVLTPAEAMGEQLLPRLQRAGLRFAVL